MRTYSLSIGFLLIASFLSPLAMATEIPTSTVLPEEFKVYYKENVGISRKAFKGSTEKTIPTKNEFKENPGCYLSCVSKDQKEGQYVFWDNQYIVGQVRVKGNYANGMCLPSGFENKDIRQAKELKAKCEETFPEKCTQGSCGVNGYTANWFY
jgi:hypothetical protein